MNPLKKERKREKGEDEERLERERELREREGEDEERLEREAPSRCFSL